MIGRVLGELRQTGDRSRGHSLLATRPRPARWLLTANSQRVQGMKLGHGVCACQTGKPPTMLGSVSPPDLSSSP